MTIMKILVIFATALFYVQAIRLPISLSSLSSASSASSEEINILVPAKGPHPFSLPGIGIVNQPVLQAVKVKVPRHATLPIKQQLISQAITAQGLSWPKKMGAEVPASSKPSQL